MGNFFVEIKHVFPVDEISKFSRVFKDTPSNVLNTKQNMDHCISIVKGHDVNSLKKFVSLTRGNKCDSEDYEIISSFFYSTQNHINILKPHLSQNRTGFYHNVVVSKVDACEVVHKMPVELWDLKYQVTCYQAFDIFSRADLVSLKTIMVSMENFPSETYVLLYPFIASIVGITTFSYCFTYLSEGNFLGTLFMKTINRISNTPFRIREIIYYRPSKLMVLISSVASSSAIYGFSQYQGREPLEQKQNVASDILNTYRFTGNTGVFIRIFKENTGAIVHSIFKIWNTYKKIIFLSFLEPIWNMCNKLINTGTR